MARQGVRTRDYPEAARRRLGKAVGQARRAAGYRNRAGFAAAARVGVRSVEAVERGEDTVGAMVLEAVGRALGRHFEGWGVQTAESILGGGAIPELDRGSAKVHLDVVWAQARVTLTGLIRDGADAGTYQRQLGAVRSRFAKEGFTDTDVLTVAQESHELARRGEG